MADHAGRDDVFLYMGGEQVVPRDVTRVIVDQSVKIIPRRAFFKRKHLVSVEFHDGVKIIEGQAFYKCVSLQRLNIPGVNIVGHAAFYDCTDLNDVEFGDELETIELQAFESCHNIRNIVIRAGRSIGQRAFQSCRRLESVELPKTLERIDGKAFDRCRSLRHIAIPLRCNMFSHYDDTFNCDELTTVELVGGIYKTISSLHLESWKIQMNKQINRINRALQSTPAGSKTTAIAEWMESVSRRFNHYRKEHYRLLKEATTLLELALCIEGRLLAPSPLGSQPLISQTTSAHHTTS